LAPHLQGGDRLILNDFSTVSLARVHAPLSRSGIKGYWDWLYSAGSGRQQSEAALTCLIHHSVIKEEPQMREQQFHQIRTQIGFAVSNLREWFRARPQTQRRLISGALGLVVVASLALVAAMPAITSASAVDVLANGGFEQGFQPIGGCGDVGSQWDCFTNGGAANYGFYDDQWASTVYEGKHSQLIEINTKGLAAGDNDRYAGISQTARVVAGEAYKLSLRGMIRSTSTEGDPWRYSVQVGWVDGPQASWKDVKNWQDVGWNTYFSRTEPGGFSAFQSQLVPDAEVITLFVRVWKKWGVASEELDVNLDAIELTGPAVNHQKNAPYHDGEHNNGYDGEQIGGIGGPVQGQQPDQFQPQGPQEYNSQDGPQEYGSQQNGPQQNGPQSQQGYGNYGPSQDGPITCGGQDLVYNGSFEGGFVKVPWGVVGKGWDAFTNGGAANYGFYNEQWDAVVADGKNGQLIEINSKAVYPTDSDRYAGISQRIAGLTPGATYELTLRGELRGVGNEDDPNRFAAQWGLGNQNNFNSVDDWTTMDLGPIQVRTEPVPLAQYKVQFKAPAQSVFLFIRGWKKFAITNVEMDFNLDAISIRACDSQHSQYPGTGGPVNQGYGNPNQGYGQDDHQDDYQDDHQDNHQAGQQPDHENSDHGNECYYIVKPGDTLSQIALDFHVSMDALARANGVDDPSAIYVGQKFKIPGCQEGSESYGPSQQGSGPDEQASNQGPQSQEYQNQQGGGPNETTMQTGPAIHPEQDEHYNDEQAQSYGPQQQPQQHSNETTYVVQPGDMLSEIAEEYGVNSYELASYNGIDNMNFIYSGQVLEIPN